MRVALLSPGPSLALYPGRAGFDSIIAVNRAAIVHCADFWSIGDYENFVRYEPELAAVPTIWTHHDTLRRIERRASGSLKALLYHRSERERWTIFSGTAALKLAIGLGADRVDCYGVDMCGEKNFDGTDEAGACRTPERWERERAAWDSIASCGAEIVRHGHL